MHIPSDPKWDEFAPSGSWVVSMSTLERLLGGNAHKTFLTLRPLFQMGASIGAEAISHLEEISEEGVRAMAASGSVAVILPTTAYILRLKSPPVRSMIEAGVIVALGSDFNPNAYCLEMVREICAILPQHSFVTIVSVLLKCLL